MSYYSKGVVTVLLLLFLVSTVSAAFWLTPARVLDERVGMTSSTVDEDLGTGNTPFTDVLSHENISLKVYLRDSEKNADSPIGLMYDGYVILQTPGDMKVDGKQIKRDDSSPIIDEEEYKITYPGYYPNMDVTFEHQIDRVKEILTINSLSDIPSSPSDAVLEYPIELNIFDDLYGNKAKLKYKGNNFEDDESNNTNGLIEIADRDGDIIWTMDEPIAYDANHNSIELNYSIKAKAKTEITLLIPYSWLETATYPVHIDPTWVTGSSILSYSPVEGTPGNAINGNTGDSWGYHSMYHDGPLAEFRIDLGANYTILGMQFYTSGLSIKEKAEACSLNGITTCTDSGFTDCTGQPNRNSVNSGSWQWWPTDANAAWTSHKARYLRIDSGEGWDTDSNINDRGCNSNGNYDQDAWYKLREVRFNVTAPNGIGCSTGTDCTSGNCIDGVCCNTACGSDCQRCDLSATNGTCTAIAVDTDPDGECGTTNCFTGNCDGASACKIYSANEEGACAACQGCTDADSACDNLADHTQDSVGSNTCTAECKECNGAGSCTNQDAAADYFNDCFNTAGKTYGCGTGSCDGSGACDYYTSLERNCPACNTCLTASSEACVAVSDNNQDTEGSNTCSSTCKVCTGGDCVNQNDGVDIFGHCTASGSGDCTDDACDGAGACDAIETGEGDCPACGTCSDTDVACEYISDNSQDDEGSNTCSADCKNCDGSGNCINQNADEDLFGQCGTVQCDAGAVTPWYWGWSSLTCYYCEDEGNSACDGSGACKDDTDYCASNPQSGTTGVICDCVGAQIDCSSTTVGSCNNDLCAAPTLNEFTADTYHPYKAPVSNGLVNFTINVTQTTSAIDKVYFWYNGTLGNVTAGADGISTIRWDVSALAVGNYSVIGSVNDTVGRESNITAIWVYVHINTAPSPTGITITGGGGDTTNKTCDFTYSDPDSHAEAYREYNWKVNDTWLDLNNENITTDSFKLDDILKCGVLVGDTWDNGTWDYSENLVVGDSTPPTIWNLSITTNPVYTNSFTALCHSYIDPSGISSSYFHLLNPSLAPSIATASESNGLYCYNLVLPAVGNWTWVQVNATDQADNNRIEPANLVIQVLETTTTTTTTTLPPSGGGVGGGRTTTTTIPQQQYTVLNWDVLSPDVIGPASTNNEGMKGLDFINTLIVESRMTVPVDFNVTMTCNTTNGTAEYCMVDWCSWKESREVEIASQSFVLSVNQYGKFYQVLECTIPYEAEFNQTYEGSVIVTGCTSSGQCDQRIVPMRAIPIDGIFFSQYSKGILETPVLLSFTGECDNMFCYNVEGASPVTLLGLTWTGFKLWHILMPLLLIVFVLTIVTAMDTQEYYYLWGVFITTEIIVMLMILFYVLT